MKLSFLALPFSFSFLFFAPIKKETENNTKNIPFISSQKISGGLFESDEILNIKLSGSIRSLFNDRGDNAPYRPLVLSYKGADSNLVTINIRAKTRGNFRRQKSHCDYPPILLNFTRKEAKPSLFDEQDKLKLVTPCVGEEYVAREYLVYKLYNLLTPKSFKARLVRVSFDDVDRKKETRLLCILLEEDEQMAKRNKSSLLELKNIYGESTETETFLKMAVFQYMIGNVDWSVPYLHNIRIISFNPTTVPSVVPYDFDHAGIVDAPYALPPEQLEMKSTKERRFRGYCITDWTKMEDVIATYNRLKDEIYKTYTSCTLLDAKYLKATTKFLDEFYETINDAKKMKAEFSFPCNPGNTNFVISGMQSE